MLEVLGSTYFDKLSAKNFWTYRRLSDEDNSQRKVKLNLIFFFNNSWYNC